MDRLSDFLQAVGYHAVIVQPLLPMYLHITLSALLPLYTGAHASLSRPSSAAKPTKRKKRIGDDEVDDVEEEGDRMMEGLSPMDAIILPLFAGTTLAGLYYLIKWLEDPALLNKILNWYFSIFGLLSLARFLTDAWGTLTSFIFPNTYGSKGNYWRIDSKLRKAKLLSPPYEERRSPLPGLLASVSLPARVRNHLWAERELPLKKLRIRVYVRGLIKTHFKIGPQGFISLLVAIAAQLGYNLMGKPWWLTNILGFSFAYNALQIMSPTTAWTGTLILMALFIYDIYFVFFTPLMVTVATNIEIPAKLLFPRPMGPHEDQSKQALSMLGLGDIVLPGIIIGYALRFDLYLFYLRKQVRQPENANVLEDSEDANASETRKSDATSEIIKAKWLPATGGWGERFWSSYQNDEVPEALQGVVFPKTYFYATITGYTIGMIITLGILQVYSHAQPALLYLVPGTLGALWGTALIKGDIKTLWGYSEAEEEIEGAASKKGNKDLKKTRQWTTLMGAVKHYEPPQGPDRELAQGELSNSQPREPTKVGANDEDQGHKDSVGGQGFSRDRNSELIFISVNLPGTPSETTHQEESAHQERSAHQYNPGGKPGRETRSKRKRKWSNVGSNNHDLGETY
ncbi:hypothetical protein JMJ35_010304 [Cladonia borealis]|uniref:Intramembrane protease n=1 Tax=Cladonia borealis TaxID=184061 RepID=A0AA39U3X9_9LECA|nr:hypothetical protein JMJ35_010304 [Cladonia borealis]